MKILFGDVTLDCEAIAFDKDGTLVDSHALWWSLYDARAPHIRTTYGDGVLHSWARMNGVDPEARALDPSGPLALSHLEEETVILAVVIYLATQKGWSVCMAEATELIALADATIPLEACTVPAPGAIDLIRAIKARGLPIAIVTSDQRERTLRMLQHLQIDDAMDCVICPEDVEHGKPAPDMLHKASDLLRVPLSKMVVVGDSRVDIEMAAAAGSPSILVGKKKAGNPEPVRLATTVIETLREIRFP